VGILITTVGVTYYVAMPHTVTKVLDITPSSNNPSSSASTSVQRTQYISDVFTVYVPDTEPPMMLELDFTRLEKTDGTYQQHHHAMGTFEGISLFESVQILTDQSSVQAADWLLQFTEFEAVDYSLRDSYQIVFTLDDMPIQLSVSELSGDFLTRGRLDYLRYISDGVASVVYGDQIYEAHVYHQRTAGIDLGTDLLFFDRDSLDTMTAQFILWDEQNNFYLFDQTKVTPDNTVYPSHTWLLYKNRTNHSPLKGYDGSVIFYENERKPTWEITTQSFGGRNFRLELEQMYGSSRQTTRGMVRGSVVTDTGEVLPVAGTVYWNNEPI